MDNPIRISTQLFGWYTELFAGDREADAAFRFLKDCGFDALDYNFELHLPTEQINQGNFSSLFDSPTEVILQHFAPVKAASQTYGITIGQAHGLYPFYVPGRSDVADHLIPVTEKILEVCQYLECPALVVHPVRQWTWEENIDLYRKLLPAAVRTGVTVCMENLVVGGETGLQPFFDPIRACPSIDRLNEEAGTRAIGFCYDMGHANITGRNFYEDICALGPRLTALHIHDNNGHSDQHLIPYTQKHPANWANCTDWDAMLAGLRQIGYRGTINLETHCAMRNTPRELIPAVLRLIAAVGAYFRTQLQPS